MSTTKMRPPLTVYSQPKQLRAVATEQRFLDALDKLLVSRSFTRLSVDEIAEAAGLTTSAFMKRFGSKKQALLVLYSRYCNKVMEELQRLTREIHQYPDMLPFCIEVSRTTERIQVADFAANRAMHELFLEELKVDPLTKEIFRGGVELMRLIQRTFLQGTPASDVGAFAAAQVLVTINYNYVLKAMPAMPADDGQRHELVGRLVAESLRL